MPEKITTNDVTPNGFALSQPEASATEFTIRSYLGRYTHTVAGLVVPSAFTKPQIRQELQEYLEKQHDTWRYKQLADHSPEKLHALFQAVLTELTTKTPVDRRAIHAMR